MWVDAQGRCTVAPYGGVRAELDREPLAGPAPWSPGQLVTVGGTLLGLARYEPPDAALHVSEDGAGVDFNRPPRLLPPERMTRFQLPRPPARPERRPAPILMAVIPVLLGVAMAYFLHQIYLLAMCALSPVMLLGTFVTDRRHGRRSYAQQMADYAGHKARIEQDAQEALDAERVQRRAGGPDPAVVLTIASGPRRRLWERRRTDPDYLLLRVGTADLPSAVELADPTQDEHRRQVFWTVPDAPVSVPLAQRGVLGIAGPGEAPRSIGRWLLAQAAVLHSPNDLQIYVLTDSSGQASWGWASWLPHCRPADGRAVALIGNDAETVAARIADLLAIIAARQRARRESGLAEVTFRQADIIVVFDGSRKLRLLPGAVQILREGPQAGVYAICLDADERLLPAECQAVTTAEAGGLRVRQMSEDTITGVRPDHVGPGWCARLARGISPVRDVSDDDDGAGLPDSGRLLDVLGLEPPGDSAIVARWQAEGGSTLAIIGESYDGPFGIDIRRDGPHGLVAGTTGSGKSELLQTIVASLAVANRPDAMTFVLVDYKGGSAFKDCVALPHTVGMVTDLDAHLVERALVSLTAELTRREHILAAAGTKDIEDYTRRRMRAGAASGLEPLPRLLIVIDEFASMVRDLPDFVTGLVNIAQRGRSLGIHLILATQRPSGAVSADIRANTNLRIALRVTDANESADVIESPEAAHISPSTPGRGYVRLGHASLVPFQAGRVGGRRPGTAAPGALATEPPWLARIDWAGAGRPEPQRPAAGHRDDEEVTDLTVLVSAIQAAARGLRIRQAHSPWLPALPRDAAAARPDAGPRYGRRGRAPGVPVRPRRPARGAATAAGLHQPGHVRAPDGGGRAAQRAVPAAADHRRLGGRHADRRRRAPLRHRLRERGAAAARRSAALRGGGHPHPGRAGHPADHPARRGGQPPPGTAGPGRFRRYPRAARRGGGRRRGRDWTGPKLPHILVLLDRWEGFTTSLGELDSGRPHRHDHHHPRRGGQRRRAPGDDRGPVADRRAHRLDDRGQAGVPAARPG